MKTRLMTLLLVAGGALFAQTRVAIGVHIGAPAPIVINAYHPPCPGPGYVWIDGFYDPYGNWTNGYWVVPPYAGAYWIAPQFMGGHFTAGYWGGPRMYRGHGYRVMAPREAFRNVPVRRGPEMRGHGGDRGHDRGGARGGEFGRGFRR